MSAIITGDVDGYVRQLLADWMGDTDKTPETQTTKKASVNSKPQNRVQSSLTKLETGRDA
jgi:hypothetical protein